MQHVARAGLRFLLEESGRLLPPCSEIRSTKSEARNNIK